MSDRPTTQDSELSTAAVLAATLEATPDGVLVVTSDGRVSHRNARFLEMWGIPEDVAAATDRQLIDYVLDRVADPDAFVTKIQHIYASSDPFLDIVALRDGRRFERRSTPLLLNDVEAGRVWVFRDVTEHERVERERLDQLAFLEDVDRIDRVIQSAGELDETLRAVVETTRDIFGCDRVWLLYPCDPDAASFSVPVESYAPDFPSAFEVRVALPIDPLTRFMMADALSTDSPRALGAGTGHPIPPDVTERFGVRSQLHIALRPNIGRPWLFGLHHCGSDRRWTTVEQQIFQEIGRRLTDGLSTLLLQNDLQERESQYRALLESANDAIVVFHGDVIEDCNRRTADLFERPLEEIVGSRLVDISEGADGLGGLSAHLDAARAGHPQVFELSRRRLGGATQYAEVSLTRFEESGTDRILAVIRDVTDRKQADRERAERLRFLSSLDGVEQILRHGDDLDEMLSQVLRELLEVFDCDRAWLLYPCDPEAASWTVPAEETREEYPGVHERGLVMPMTEDAAQSFREALSSDDPIAHSYSPGEAEWDLDDDYSVRSSFSMAIHPKSGKPWTLGLHQCSRARSWTDQEGVLLREVGRRLADAMGSVLILRELRESEEQFRALYEQAAVGIALVDLDGRWAQFNEPMATMLGHEEEELIGHPWDEDLHPSDMEARAGLEALLRGERENLFVEQRFETRRRGTVWVTLAAQLLRAGDGAPRYISCVVTDISERKRAEQMQRDLESQLRQTQKMEAVGQLAGGMAHDFNNMLTAIRGSAEIARLSIQETPPALDAVDDGLRQIVESVERANDLTGRLLTFSRNQVSSPRVRDVSRLVADLKKMLRRVLTETISLESQLDPSAPPVFMDPGELQQIVLNLAINARDAMPEGGTLTVETRRRELTEEDVATLPDAKPGLFVCLAVRDTGSGMAPETAERIFEPFFTTKPLGKGTGLGLATVYAIVRKAGGHVRLETAPGRGTTFEVLLPAAPADVAPSPAAETTAESAAPGGGETILVCEDDRILRSLARRFLTREGYRVIVAADGRDALNKVADFDEPIDLLVTDVIMPNMDGRRLSERLTAERPDMRTLFLSGYTADVLSPHGVETADVEFLPKPYGRVELLRTVRRILDQ